MATNTTNLSLIKPDLTDKIRIAQINQNMDIIDEKLGPVGSTSLQSQVTPLTTKTANYDKLIENGTDLNSLLTTGVYKSPATAAGVHTLSNCPVETPFVMVVRGEGEIDGCVQLLCGGVSIYTRRGTGSGFPAEWTVPTGGATPSGEYTIDDLYDAIDELLANAKDDIVAELVDDTAGEGDTGKVWSADKLATSFDEKANVDGYYEEMAVGSSEQLISTVSVQDNAPYLFRTSGGNADIGDREVDKLIGGTVAWNQIQKNTRSVSGNGVTFTFNNGALSVLSDEGGATGESYWLNASSYKFDFIKDHIYFVYVGGNYSYSSGTNPLFYIASGFGVQENTNTKLTKPSSILKCTFTVTQYLQFLVYTGNEINATYYPQIFDLTQMFGSSIANYIYSLETATAGAGVAWFKRYFPKPYYAYNAGELMSVKALSHDTVGFNAWDEEWEGGLLNLTTGQPESNSSYSRSKNFCPCVPSTVYYGFRENTSITQFIMLFYDASKNYISYTNLSTTSGLATSPANARYFKLRFNIGTLSGKVNINLHWDGERDGEYEPYEKHSYSLGNVELHGIPKLDSDNKLYYDGDTYESNGTVTRKYRQIKITSVGGISAGGCVRNSNGLWVCGFGGLSASDYAQKPQVPICDNIPVVDVTYSSADMDCICKNINSNQIGVIALTDATSGLTASSSTSDVATALANYINNKQPTFVYELATPTTETADPFQNPQIVDDFGTEEYVDRGVATSARDVAIPVGHETSYQANLRAKLEMAPNSPADGDGDYIVRQTSGINEYIKWDDSEIGEAIDAVEEAKEDKNVSAPAIIDTASGTIATFSDGADDRPIKHCIAQINPVQDLHGYDNPWPGGGGKNLIDFRAPKSVSSSLIFSANENASVITISSVGTAYSYASVSYDANILIGKTVYINYTKETNANLGYVQIRYLLDGNTQYVEVGSAINPSQAFAIPNTAQNVTMYFMLRNSSGDGATGDYVKYINFIVSETANNTFSPYENICPITGWTGAKVTRTGKNLFDKTATDTSKGYKVNYYLNSSGAEVSFSGLAISEYISAKGNTAYILSNVGGASPSVCFYDFNKTFISGIAYGGNTNVSFTTPANCFFIRLSIVMSSINNIQLELGSTVTAYEPYSGQTYNITFPTEAGTVYGGTLTIAKDGSGTLVVNKGAHIFTGKETVVESGNANGYMMIGGTNNLFMGQFNIYDRPVRNYPIPMMSHFYGRSYIPSTEADIGDASTFMGANGKTLGIKTSFNETSEFTSWLAEQHQAGTPVTVVLPLAAEYQQTYSLTASQIKTLLGQNNIFADTGDTSVSYPADTKLYIDKKFAELQAALNG